MLHYITRICWIDLAFYEVQSIVAKGIGNGAIKVHNNNEKGSF